MIRTVTRWAVHLAQLCGCPHARAVSLLLGVPVAQAQPR